MGCLPCQKARQRALAAASRGKVVQTVKAVSLGARIMAEKITGATQQDILERYADQLGVTVEELEAMRNAAQKPNRRA